MDKVKLDKWKNEFFAKANNINMEFNSFFKSRKLEDHYSLRLDESSEYAIEASNNLPQEIKQRLIRLLAETKPEDSI